jgi:hypothetical protein
VCFLLFGCRIGKAPAQPAIEFTRVPQTTDKGLERLDIIEGRAIGARPGQRIVLYAKNGAWWVQPLVSLPFTNLQPNSSWINSTHLGTDYAALLVEPGYRPPTTVAELPVIGNGVVAVASAKGYAEVVSKTVSFSGYEWRIRNAPSSRGGGMNDYDPKNVWTDSNGAMHLKLTKVSGKWVCAEASLTRNLGYGTYSFVVRDTTQLKPAAVFGMFIYDYAGNEPNHREMSMEMTRWGDSASKNAQFVVQPFYIPTNVARFEVPQGVVTHSFRWEPGRITFRTVRGAEIRGNAPVISEHVFDSGVPSTGAESVRVNLYVFKSSKEPLQNEEEIVIEKFQYFP